MVAKVEKRGAGFYMVSEANGFRSREEITIIDGQELSVGAVLGQITISGKYTEVDLVATDGSEDAVAVLFDEVVADGFDVAVAAHVRDCEVLGAELVYPDGSTGGDIDTINAALLANSGIAVR